MSIVAVVTQEDQINNQADVLELRVDLLGSIDVVKSIMVKTSKPVILTLRSKSQGGNDESDKDSREKLLLELVKLEPDYIDIEHTDDNGIIDKIKKEDQNIKIIKSYHNFSYTPGCDTPVLNAPLKDGQPNKNILNNKVIDGEEEGGKNGEDVFESLDGALNNMRHPGVDIYKFSTMASSSLDAMRMLQFVQKYQGLVNGHCMGADGEFSRVVGAVIGNQFIYASISSENDSLKNDIQKSDDTVNHAIAPGLLSINDLIDIYRLNLLSSKTRCYALLGDPIDKSQGHIFHNKTLTQDGKAVYVKIRLEKSELKQFFELAKDLPFDGYSVTMPLKELIAPHVEASSNANDDCLKYSQKDEDIDFVRFPNDYWKLAVYRDSKTEPDKRVRHVIRRVPKSSWSYDAPSIGVFNTIKVVDKKLYAINTDIHGALSAIFHRYNGDPFELVADKNALVIGAGATAKSLSLGLIREGAKLCIVNRTFENSQSVSDVINRIVMHMNGAIKGSAIPESIALDYQMIEARQEKFTFDLIINTVPAVAQLPIDVIGGYMRAGTVFMDVSCFAPHVALGNAAVEAGCIILDGYQMFVKQAELQQEFWLI